LVRPQPEAQDRQASGQERGAAEAAAARPGMTWAHGVSFRAGGGRRAGRGQDINGPRTESRPALATLATPGTRRYNGPTGRPRPRRKGGTSHGSGKFFVDGQEPRRADPPGRLGLWSCSRTAPRSSSAGSAARYEATIRGFTSGMHHPRGSGDPGGPDRIVRGRGPCPGFCTRLAALAIAVTWP